MAMMKQVVMGLSQRQPSRSKVSDSDGRSKSASLHLPRFQQRNDFETHDDLDVVKPGPLSLVRAAARICNSTSAL